MLQLLQRPLVDDVAGVERGRRLEQKQPALLVGNGAVLGSARHDDEFPFFDPFVAIAEFHAESAFDHQEHFVLVLMMMEDELALQLVELDVLTVEFGRDVRLPVFGNLGELIGDVNLLHNTHPYVVARQLQGAILR